MLPAWKIPVTRHMDREFPGELRRTIAAWGKLSPELRPTALFAFDDPMPTWVSFRRWVRHRVLARG